MEELSPERGAVHREEGAPAHLPGSPRKRRYPGGVLFKQENVPELVRQIRRLPRSKARERLLALVERQLPAAKTPAAAPVLSRRASDQEDEYAATADLLLEGQVLDALLTASRGVTTDRVRFGPRDRRGAAHPPHRDATAAASCAGSGSTGSGALESNRTSRSARLPPNRWKRFERRVVAKGDGERRWGAYFCFDVPGARGQQELIGTAEGA